MIVIISNRKKLTTILYVLIFIVFFMVGANTWYNSEETAETVNQVQGGLLAVIIDDFGNKSEGTDEMLKLPIKFTGAVMPFMPFTTTECELLKEAGKEVILHMPMEAHHGKRSWLGKKPIMNDYSEETVNMILNEAFSEMRYCVGINNHMGSKVTENEKIFNTVMEFAKTNELIFVDSVTTGKSVVEKAALKNNVFYLKRDVFLDSTQSIEKVKSNLRKAGDIALKNGFAVAIGHVGAEGGRVTAKALKEMYGELEEKGVKFVTVREMVRAKNS